MIKILNEKQKLKENKMFMINLKILVHLEASQIPTDYQIIAKQFHKEIQKQCLVHKENHFKRQKEI